MTSSARATSDRGILMPSALTIGMVVVATFAAKAEGVPPVATIPATRR